MKRNDVYVAPVIDVCIIAVEQGFSLSNTGNLEDIEDGGEI